MHTTIDTNKNPLIRNIWMDFMVYARVNATNISEVRRNKPTNSPIFATIRSRNKQLAYTNTCAHTRTSTRLVHVLRSISSNWLTYRETRSHTLPFERTVHTTSQPTSSSIYWYWTIDSVAYWICNSEVYSWSDVWCIRNRFDVNETNVQCLSWEMYEKYLQQMRNVCWSASTEHNHRIGNGSTKDRRRWKNPKKINVSE